MFNQLLFDLEAEVFGYFKDWAASTSLDKMFKRVFEARRGWGHFIPGRRRYEVLHVLYLLYARAFDSCLWRQLGCHVCRAVCLLALLLYFRRLLFGALEFCWHSLMAPGVPCLVISIVALTIDSVLQSTLVCIICLGEA